jgi:hypothetical protein
MNYYEKYIKYKNKYLKLKYQLGGNPEDSNGSAKKYKSTPMKQPNNLEYSVNSSSLISNISENTPIKKEGPNVFTSKLSNENLTNSFSNMFLGNQNYTGTPFTTPFANFNSNSNSNSNSNFTPSKLSLDPTKLSFGDEDLDKITETERVLTNSNNNLYIYILLRELY